MCCVFDQREKVHRSLYRAYRGAYPQRKMGVFYHSMCHVSHFNLMHLCVCKRTCETCVGDGNRSVVLDFGSWGTVAMVKKLQLTKINKISIM